MLSVGLAHGLIEAVINPLAATLYPDDKTHKLNVLHAWWPGGIIIGGLIAVALGHFHVSWQIKQGVIILPALVYGIMALAVKFPATERVAAGVSDKAMFAEALKPLFIVWWICMWFTATTELTTGQWIDAFLKTTVQMQGVLLLVYWSGLMFVMRHFAGGLAHKFSPVGLMWFSSLLAGVGLLILSVANSALTGILAATVFGVGICYMWPTMLAVASEQFPKGGAFLMGLMGTAGNLSILITMPALGAIFDHYKVKIAADMGTTFENALVQSKAASISFQWTAVLPAVLIVLFGILWLRDKAMGGYKAVKLTSEPAPEKVEV
jgi:MFS family permease